MESLSMFLDDSLFSLSRWGKKQDASGELPLHKPVLPLWRLFSSESIVKNKEADITQLPSLNFSAID